MPRPVTASLKFLKEPVADKLTYSEFQIGKLTTNAATFPNLPFNIAALQNAHDILEEKAGDAESGDHEAHEALINAEHDWDKKFRDTAHYIGDVAEGNAETIRAGGAVPTKDENEPASLPAAAQKITYDVQNVQPGSCHVECEAVPGAKYYIFVMFFGNVSGTITGNQINLNMANQKTIIISGTLRKVTFTNLESQQKYQLIVIAGNSAGLGPMSTPKNITVQ